MEVALPNGFEGLGTEHNRKERFHKGVGGVEGHGCAVGAREVFPEADMHPEGLEQLPSLAPCATEVWPG